MKPYFSGAWVAFVFVFGVRAPWQVTKRRIYPHHISNDLNERSRHAATAASFVISLPVLGAVTQFNG